jgi:hypothetical protein
MYWTFLYWLVTKVLWRKGPKPGSKCKIEVGFKLFHWFTPYPEYKGHVWYISSTHNENHEAMRDLYVPTNQPNKPIVIRKVK